jgi:hypothetical protein
VPSRCRLRIAAALLLLGLVFGLPRQLALARIYRARLAAASLVWTAGLWALAARPATPDSSYSVEAGAYVSAGLLLAGLVATVQVNRNGTARDPTAASAPRERSPTGP